MSKLDSKNNFRMESLNALFEHATEGIIISNKKGEILRANPSSERLFGFSDGELLGKVIEDLVPRKYSNSHVKNRENYNQNPHARSMGKNMDLYARRKDNSEFPVEISLSYFKQGEETFVIAFVIDITERKRHEANVIKLNQDLEKKVDERTKVLHEALIELESSKEKLSLALEAEKGLNDMKSRFVTMASHEFRTPLSTILSSISLVDKYKAGANDDKIGKHVQRIKSAVTNMTLILNDFLSAEKLDEGKVFVRKVELDLPLLITEVIQEMQGILKTGQKLDFVNEGESIAWLDKQMIRNILLNLISNAIKFSPENKSILINVEVDPKTVKIEVSDKGMGIPKEEQEHLFERFFRAKNATNIQGTGLGLNIVVKYLESMNGTIEFKSELGEGTTFYIRIPNEKQN
ncbi:PAS domain-containing sensor histidine kinase [Aurantibacillus circumpalustris]|uniref:PAS domain-containing sensor histidine kinase n=1 Tax=Aurantibacillus circumpalustris TaxID=3036359 RepID=UPI00295BDD61|nr:PAS domain-containing sensor histidine kinase [Aurantibacillus circumpalustris]